MHSNACLVQDGRQQKTNVRPKGKRQNGRRSGKKNVRYDVIIPNRVTTRSFFICWMIYILTKVEGEYLVRSDKTASCALHKKTAEFDFGESRSSHCVKLLKLTPICATVRVNHTRLYLTSRPDKVRLGQICHHHHCQRIPPVRQLTHLLGRMFSSTISCANHHLRLLAI